MGASSRAGTRPQGRRGFWRRLFSWKGILGLILGLVLLGLATFAVAYLLIPVPDPNERAQAQTSIIYYADGKTEMARFAQVNRESVPLEQVPLPVQRAMLAAEDRSFYDNPGFSPTGIGRALWAAVTGGQRQGGSTITQQYVKNYFLTQDQTVGRKLRELIISVKVEQQLSKEAILQDYLNTIYFGRGADGIQAASRAYFGQDVKTLDVAQGALLASVIRAPSLYDPSLGAEQKQNAEQRFAYVLDGMVEQGWLSAAQRRTAAFPKVLDPKPRSSASGPNGYLVAMVKSELASKIGLSDAEIDRGGLRITTTVLRKNQTAAIEAVEQKRPSGGKADDVRVGLASVKPGDGAILALYGGKNFATQPYNAATQAQLQAGSTFKVFTLVGALEKGISTKTPFDGSSPQYFSEFRGGGNANGRVTNFGGESFGFLSVRDALAKSVNTIFAQLNIRVGPQATVNAAVKLGLPANTLGLADNY
ncbi:MAG: transglycosylase domain-containing protein, partial [Micrococcales bacterium]|nr:transglycosylase domain-containing protein [Micrococcales bacterium]